MTAARASISTSLDGFVAGPNDGRENALGDDGERLHVWIYEWIYDLASRRAVHGLAGGEPNRVRRSSSDRRSNGGWSTTAKSRGEMNRSAPFVNRRTGP